MKWSGRLVLGNHHLTQITLQVLCLQFCVSEKKGADPVEDTVPKVNGDGVDLSMAGTRKG